MAYAIPSAANVKARFPEFLDVDDGVIEFAIEEAQGFINDSWTQNQTLAIYYKAAHLLSLTQQAADNDGQTITSETFGRISVTYGSSASASGAVAGEPRTIYGDRYAQYARQNFPTGIMAV